VRKITGDCFNQVMVKATGNVFASATNTATRLSHPMIFRVISSWYNTREDMLRLLNGTMSGPSTTAGTDMNLNRHVWIQGGVKVTQTLRNPCSYPIHVTIWKSTLKCDDVGPVKGAYVEGTLPFAGTASALDAANSPDAVWWDFFDQSNRQPAGTSSDTGYQKFTADDQMTINQGTGGVYGSNLFQAGNQWEKANGAASSMDFRETVSLEWLFPNMRKKLRTRVVFKGWIPALGCRTYTYNASHPSEIRPRDLLDPTCPNFSKHSYFLTMRAFAKPEMDTRPTYASQNAGVPAMNLVPSGYWRPPAAVVITEQRVYRLRRGGDSQPTFASVDGNTAAASGGWLGANWGLTRYGTTKGAPDHFAANDTITASGTLVAPVWLPMVPSYRTSQVPYFAHAPGDVIGPRLQPGID